VLFSFVICLHFAILVSTFRQHIQPIITLMAVVIQKMVQAEAAGVLFSRHPLNGDPSVIVITANYGLGESVVSNKADPDTFLVKKSYTDEFEILASKAGDKKILIEMDDEASVKDVEIDGEKRKKLCLSEEVVLKLARLGVIMEKFFGSPRDIEFAVTKDETIYLL
jgi:pyruvate, water dikinase